MENQLQQEKIPEDPKILLLQMELNRMIFEREMINYRQNKQDVNNQDNKIQEQEDKIKNLTNENKKYKSEIDKLKQELNTEKERNKKNQNIIDELLKKQQQQYQHQHQHPQQQNPANPQLIQLLKQPQATQVQQHSGYSSKMISNQYPQQKTSQSKHQQQQVYSQQVYPQQQQQQRIYQQAPPGYPPYPGQPIYRK